MNRPFNGVLGSCGLVAALLLGLPATASESLWIEAEQLQGVEGYCWPMSQQAAMRETKGHWGISGPGWAAEWNQGGESGFLSIACGAADDKAVATADIEIPAAGSYNVWVRYRDTREQSDRFQITVRDAANKTWAATYGERPVVEEDHEAKLYWNWAFGWEKQTAVLAKGMARLELASNFQEADCRQIDCIVVTSDAAYRPATRERPHNDTWDVLEGYRTQPATEIERLTRNRPNTTTPEVWRPRTFNDKGFFYAWNMDDNRWPDGTPGGMLVPYAVRDADTRASFERKYAGKPDVPIFSDPRLAPVFHTVTPMLATDSAAAAQQQSAAAFGQWLEAKPERAFGSWAPAAGLAGAAQANMARLRGHYIGSFARDSMTHFAVPAAAMQAATGDSKSRRALAEAIGRSIVERAKAAPGVDPERIVAETVPLNIIGGMPFHALAYRWGARTVGYETAVTPATPLSMQWAFLRGAARQNGGLTATYRYYRYGDSATTFSDAGATAATRFLFDNYYSAYSGPGMTWAKLDTWYQYMAGSSFFLEEQGNDVYWMPGGAAAGRGDVQLSPKGKLIDRFLRLTAREPERGVPFTPVALLADYAHGWEPSPYLPYQYGDYGQQPAKTHYGLHEQAMREYTAVAFYPVGPRGQQATTAVSENYVPGVFGDIFDVVYAYPEMERWRTIDTYAAVIVTGDIELTAPEGQRLRQYVENGGTLVVAEGQLQGPGAAAIALPAAGAAFEGEGYRWLGGAAQASQRYRGHAVNGGRALATTAEGQAFCAAYERGKGRLIYLGVPYGLGIDRAAHPVVARLFRHITAGVMPVEVRGEVEWSVNRTARGWLVTLLNPAGVNRPQQGMTPTQDSETRTVTIVAQTPLKSARDRLSEVTPLAVQDGVVTCTVPAGGVCVVELE